MSATTLMFLGSSVFVAEMIDVAVSDVRSFQIPNRIPLILIASFLAVAVFSGMGWTDFLSHISSGFVLFVLSTALFMGGIWGGGDAKLLPAVALWVGLVGQPRFLLVMAFVGGLLAVSALMVRHMPLRRVAFIHAWGENFMTSGQVPYGLAIAAAGIDWWFVSVIPQFVAGS